MQANQDLILLIALGVGLMLLLAVAFILFFTFSQNKLRNHQLRAEQAKLAHQRELLNSTIMTQEHERARIAKDLHDEVGSRLNVMHLFLHQLTRKVPEAKAHITEVLEVITQTIQTTRRISHELLPPTLEKFGLATAFEEFLEQLKQADDLAISYEHEGERPCGLTTEIELNLFRIAQELLQNTIKYAQASHAYLHLQQTQDKLILRYRDDGKGFDPSSPSARKGLGLQNIESRLQIIDGTWQLRSQPGQGVGVRIEVKLKKATELQPEEKVLATALLPLSNYPHSQLSNQ